MTNGVSLPNNLLVALLNLAIICFMLDFYAPLLPVDFLLQILTFLNYIFKNTVRVSIRLSHDQAQRKFGPDLIKNCLQM